MASTADFRNGMVLQIDGQLFQIVYFQHVKPGKGGEVWLADAVKRLNKTRPIYGRKIEGKLYDAGTVLGWLKANIELGLQHSKINSDFRKYLRQLKF